MGSATDEKIFDQLAQTVIDGQTEKCVQLITEGLKRGMNPLEAVEKGLGKGIAKVGEDFGSGVVFLPELTMAADVMKAGIEVLDKEIKASGETRAAAGKMVIGTIKGDIHDIGKSVVAAVLQANAYDVVDLGIDVELETFLKAVVEHQADVLGMSTLLTLPLMEMGRVIEQLDKEGLRGDVKVIVGGCPVTEQFAKEIGADAVGFDAQDAVVKVDGLLRVDRSALGAG